MQAKELLQELLILRVNGFSDEYISKKLNIDFSIIETLMEMFLRSNESDKLVDEYNIIINMLDNKEAIGLQHKITLFENHVRSITKILIEIKKEDE
jgi:hypothetical protein